MSQELMPPRKVLNCQSRQLVLNVLEYFENKKKNSTENVPVIRCASEALKLSERTISRIRHEGPTGINKPHTKNRKALKGRDIPEVQKQEIRNAIYDMIDRKQDITLEKLSQELEIKNIIEVSSSSLRRILKDMGFKYTVDNGRRALMETSHIVSKVTN